METAKKHARSKPAFAEFLKVVIGCDSSAVILFMKSNICITNCFCSCSFSHPAAHERSSMKLNQKLLTRMERRSAPPSFIPGERLQKYVENRRMLQENAWHVIQIASYHTNCIRQMNIYGYRLISSPGIRSFYCQTSQDVMVRPYDKLPNIILQGTVDDSRRSGRPRKS